MQILQIMRLFIILSISEIILFFAMSIVIQLPKNNDVSKIDQRKISQFPLVLSASLIKEAYGSNRMENNDFKHKREDMVNILRNKGIKNESVLGAMKKVERHLFMPSVLSEYAYEDKSFPIACEQTISQPYIVAFMTEAAKLDKKSVVLEIGTGSGYQAAILSEICASVYSIEIIPNLKRSSCDLLDSLGYANVSVKLEDGYLGWKEKAPFDAVIVTAAARKISEELLNQLKIGGRIIMPLEDEHNQQRLVKITKTTTRNDYITEYLLDVRFVPMVGLAKK